MNFFMFLMHSILCLTSRSSLRLWSWPDQPWIARSPFRVSRIWVQVSPNLSLVHQIKFCLQCFSFCGILLLPSDAAAWGSCQEFSRNSVHSGLSIHFSSNINCFTSFSFSCGAFEERLVNDSTQWASHGRLGLDCFIPPTLYWRELSQVVLWPVPVVRGCCTMCIGIQRILGPSYLLRRVFIKGMDLMLSFRVSSWFFPWCHISLMSPIHNQTPHAAPGRMLQSMIFRFYSSLPYIYSCSTIVPALLIAHLLQHFLHNPFFVFVLFVHKIHSYSLFSSRRLYPVCSATQDPLGS